MIKIEKELRDKIIMMADHENIPYESYEGVLDDNYILYDANNVTVEGLLPAEYIVLHNKYVNEWTCEIELIATNDISLVNKYKEMYEQ